MDEIDARSMSVKELKERVDDDSYVVDPQAVAEALLRRRKDILFPVVTRRRGARGRAAAEADRRPAS